MEEIEAHQLRMREAWNQKHLPIILRRNGKGEKLRVRLPDISNPMGWLRRGRRSIPAWNPYEKCWEIPKRWFSDFVNDALETFGSVYVIQPYNEQEKCAPACMNAQGHECECSCMGANHGAGNDGSWFEVSETFATRWNGRELACRLMHATSSRPKKK